MPTFTNLGVDEPSTVDFEVACVSVTRNSSAELQEILCLGDSSRSDLVANVLSTTPGSTFHGLVVRTPSSNQVALASTQVVVMATSTGGLLTGSTTPASTAQGVTVRMTSTQQVLLPSTQSIQVKNSTIGGLLAQVDQNSTVWPVQIASTQTVVVATSTGGLLTGDSDGASTQQALYVRQIGGAASSTQVAISSGIVQVQNISSSGASLTSDATPASTAQALHVRAPSSQQVQLPSTQVVELNSTQTVVVATSTGGLVTTDSAPASTAQGVVVRIPSTNQVLLPSTQSIQVKNSTIGGLLASVQQNSTVWAVQLPSTQGAVPRDSTGGLMHRNTPAQSTSHGVVVREALPALLSTGTEVTSSASTAFYTLIAGSASTTHRVFAFSVTSTIVTPGAVDFLSGTNATKWKVGLGSASSGVMGANLATSPPGYLFATDTGAALSFRAGTTGVYRVSISYFSVS